MRERGNRIRELEEEGSALLQELSEVNAVKTRLTRDLAAAAEQIRSFESQGDVVSEKITSLERDELLAGTVVVRLSEHITAVEEATVQARGNVQHTLQSLTALLKEMHAFNGDNEVLKEVSVPVVTEPVEDQYRLLGAFTVSLQEVAKRVVAEWGQVRSAVDAVEAGRDDACQKVQELQGLLEAAELVRDVQHEDLQLKDEKLGQMQKGIEAAQTHIAATETRLLGLIRDSEGEVNTMQV